MCCVKLVILYGGVFSSPWNIRKQVAFSSFTSNFICHTSPCCDRCFIAIVPTVSTQSGKVLSERERLVRIIHQGTPEYWPHHVHPSPRHKQISRESFFGLSSQWKGKRECGGNINLSILLLTYNE